MPLPTLFAMLPVASSDLLQMALLGLATVLTLVLGGAIVQRRLALRPRRSLLGGLATDSSPVSVYLRGLFVPNNEFFSRSPEYPPTPGGGMTVHKWVGVAEVHGAADVRAAAEVIHLLSSANGGATFSIRSADATSKGRSENALAIGQHHKAIQMLDQCEPRLVAFRNPDAFRSLVSQEIFEAKGGSDFGLIYKGRPPASSRDFWVVMGLGDLGTEAAAYFLRTRAHQLGQLTGGAPFAAVVAVGANQARETAVMRSLQPRPSWWRRLIYRKALQKLTGAPGPGPA